MSRLLPTHLRRLDELERLELALGLPLLPEERPESFEAMRNKAIAIAILTLTSSHAAIAAGNPWRVTEAAGQVQIVHGSARTGASRGRPWAT